eukprot:6554056-Pyramimonas_sp.AAC.1
MIPLGPRRRDAPTLEVAQRWREGERVLGDGLRDQEFVDVALVDGVDDLQRACAAVDAEPGVRVP